MNLYGYVLNDPVNGIDPEGLFWGSIATRGGGKGILSGGTGVLTGGIIGGFTGAALGTATGIPGMGIVGGLAGGWVGGKIGGLFNSPCAGELNCNEDDMLPPPSPPACGVK